MKLFKFVSKTLPQTEATEMNKNKLIFQIIFFMYNITFSSNTNILKKGTGSDKSPITITWLYTTYKVVTWPISMADHTTRSQGKHRYKTIKSKRQPLCARTSYSYHKLCLFLYTICYLVSLNLKPGRKHCNICIENFAF